MACPDWKIERAGKVVPKVTHMPKMAQLHLKEVPKMTLYKNENS